MKWLLRFLRSVVVWAGPVLVLFLMVLCGFLFWVITTSPGTRWAVVTAVQALDGRVERIQGSFWDGMTVGTLDLGLPDLELRARELALDVNWRELAQRRLHVRELSADTLELDIITDTSAPPAEPFVMPSLPVAIAVDRLALGALDMRIDGGPLPVSVRDVASAVAVNAGTAQVVLQSLTLGHDTLQVTFDGEAQLQSLAAPWPATISVHAVAQGAPGDSPLCARRYLPSLPAVDAAADAGGCELAVDIAAQGDLQALQVTASGQGQGMGLQAWAQLRPQAPMPLDGARVDLALADGSSLKADVTVQTVQKEGMDQDHVTGTLAMRALNVGQLVGPAIPAAVLTADSTFSATLVDRRHLEKAAIELTIAPESRWNEQPLGGKIDIAVNNPGASEQGASGAEAAVAWEALQLPKVAIDLALGRNRVKADGEWGATGGKLSLDLAAPELRQLWPDLPGGASLKGALQGSVADHRLNLTTVYTPADSVADELGKAPVALELAAQGGWSVDTGQPPRGEGWRGSVAALDIRHADVGVRLASPASVQFFPHAPADTSQWQVGSTQIEARVNQQRWVVINHRESSGREAVWATRGDIDRLSVSPARVRTLKKALGLDDENDKPPARGGVKVLAEQGNDRWAIDFAADWDLAYTGALRGTTRIRRVSGDVMVPAEPDFPLGLRQFELGATAIPVEGGHSRIEASLQVATERMGQAKVQAKTVLRQTPAGGFTLDPSDIKTVDVQAAIADIGWASLFTGDAVDFGGSVQADLRLRAQSGDDWQGTGTITGKGLRIVRVDDGVRLLDGTLSARLDGERLILEQLTFPAQLRVTPKEWRTATWVSENPDAKGGKLTLSGDWHVLESRGRVNVDFHRYPILQRADRYAMISGALRLNAELPKVDIQGEITADAGWFGLDMLGSVPVIDSDVIILKPGQKTVIAEPPALPLDVSMNVKIDLGPRFYLTGYGVNSGLVGDLTLSMVQGKLTAIGALRTRGGAVEAYGQRLQLRRGTITFQGDITSPILNIEALRTGLQVEAGVRVAGTARRPRIDLVSYPEVSEIEKLSWLLLGHGPNDSGGDVALLFSVGTSFLSEGEPFYQKFGIDEITMRSGDVGAASSILPAESVVSGLNDGTSDIERRFVQASKRITDDLTLSLRQALSDTGTVGRLGYRLARGLNAELTVGTVNGLALVYRWFSRD